MRMTTFYSALWCTAIVSKAYDYTFEYKLRDPSAPRADGAEADMSLLERSVQASCLLLQPMRA